MVATEEAGGASFRIEMKGIINLGLAVALALAWCTGAQAQMRTRGFAPVRATRPASTHVVRTRQLQTVATPFGSDAFLLSDTTFPFGPLPTGTFPVPGLGFDFAHLAAISRNFKVSDISVLSTAQRLALTQRLASLTSFGVPFFPAASPVIFVPQPPVVVVQQPAAAEETAEAAERPRTVAVREAAVPVRPPEPAHDAGEFVLVRRDGRLVFAVAFSTEGDELTYVTREGVRRSLRLVELDIDATRRMNGERGTTIHLPA